MNIPVRDWTMMDIFNLVLTYYSNDPYRQSINPSGGCQYNGQDGRHCAYALVTLPGYRKRLEEESSADSQLRELGIRSVTPHVRKCIATIHTTPLGDLSVASLMQGLHDEHIGFNGAFDAEAFYREYGILIK